MRNGRLTVVTEQTRWISLEGAANVRDLGGLPTMDGRTTRFGRVLRSDNLQSLTEKDVALAEQIDQLLI